jgi:hypothetical protein
LKERRDPDRRYLARDDFRRERALLAPHVFALGPDEPDYPPPTDRVPEEAWKHVVDLPTDVLLKTTSYQGSTALHLSELSLGWHRSLPLEEGSIADIPAWDARDELEALVFIAWHGYYRQALGCLRNALENLLIAVSYQVRIAEAGAADRSRLQREHDEWKRRVIRPGYTRSRQALAATSTGRRVDAAAGEPILGAGGLLAERYVQLCGYAHSHPDLTNVAVWESNGPIWRDDVLDRVVQEARVTIALMVVVYAMGDPTLKWNAAFWHTLDGLGDGWVAPWRAALGELGAGPERA